MGFRIPFTCVLTVLTLILSLVPAVIIWVVFMDLMTSSVDLLRSTTQDSTDRMAERMQELLILQAIERVTSRLTEGENEMLVQRAMVHASGLLDYDLRPSVFDVRGQFLKALSSRNFVTMKGHTLFSGMTTSGAIQVPGTNRTTICVALSWATILVDTVLGTANRTLYQGTLAMDATMQRSTVNLSYVDQTTAVPLRVLSNTTLPTMAYTVTMVDGDWDTDLSFNIYSGQVEFGAGWWMPAQNGTWVEMSLAISAETISDELRDQLAGAPDDRLVVFFRQPHGHMVAASNGKFYSHSDVDRRYINPISNPPDIKSYRLWTCLQSDDPFIQEACQQIYGTYQSWTAIPDFREETLLQGQRYWAAVDHSNTSLQCTVLMLKNRATVMGSIDASNAQVDQSITNKKGVTFVVLGVVAAVAVLLPLSLGLWLAARLYTLAAGMDRIAKLQFTEASTPRSVFRELHRFQTSFVQMERGLQAFGKFVPQAVVRVLIAGQMKSTDEMNPETLTVMFADIEGFSTICENESPATLVAVCTEYFEAMCSNIIQHNGTIDKFIGDCIMAMWNAPDRLFGHEKEAVTAALAMQSAVLERHEDWQQRGLPVLKFRLGLHTGVCLVGNFGCSYRVSYTCLGDSVNLSSRLEALNKKFGTYICVSHGTYQGCCEDFHFRKLAKVTVPGKTEVLPVYEVLCAWQEDEITVPCFRQRPAKPPGTLSKDDDLESFRGEDSLRPARRLPPPTQQKVPGSDPSMYATVAGQLPYHWAYVDRGDLLQQASQYEAAYEAMVAGNPEEARLLLRAEPLLDIPDKAWAALADQLERTEAGHGWDGVFYFREK
eukprot:EG_transcript_980